MNLGVPGVSQIYPKKQMCIETSTYGDFTFPAVLVFLLVFGAYHSPRLCHIALTTSYIKAR